MPDWISHEPARWLGVASAGVVLAVSLGLPLTPEQQDALHKFGIAVAALFVITGELIRSQVVPTAKIEEVPAAAQALKAAGERV